MRILTILPLLVLAGCGGEEEKAKAPAAQALQAGQWETTTQVASVRPLDEGTPRIQTKQGTTTTASFCLAAADVGRPPPELFVGPDYDCEYNNFYMSNGRFNVSLQCTRDGLNGKVTGTVDGTYGADQFEMGTEISTALITDGDVRIRSQVRGRRTGECQPSAESGGNQSAAK